MNTAVAGLLAFAVLSAWIGLIAFLRLRTPFDRLHVVAFINVAVGGAVTAAAVMAGGASGSTFKSLFVWIAMLAIGALLAHATARALHLRDGERR